MASFTISYMFRMIDQFTPGANRLASSAKKVAGAVKSAGQAANATVGSLNRVGQAANRAASGFQRYGQMALSAAQKAGAAAKGAFVGIFGRGTGRADRGMGFAGALGTLGIGYWGKNLLQRAKEGSMAENKFRSLVDSVTPEQMLSLRNAMFEQMKITGESFPALLDAAAEVAQIVGNADLARDITVAGSKLAKIDTAGKSTKDLSEMIAAVVGPGGTFEEINRIADMLAKQQKLGAATAGGTIEAYKDIAPYSKLMKVADVQVLSAIGLIKNLYPALQDSQIGKMGTYGIRMMTMPNTTEVKKLKQLGWDRNSFLNADGGFDILKAHQAFYELSQTKGGIDKIKDLFSGRNKLAGQFWLNLLQVTPENFRKYVEELEGSGGTLMKAIIERTKGLEGAMNRLGGASEKAAFAFAEFLTPALEDAANKIAPYADKFSTFVKDMQENYPVLTKWVGRFLIGLAALSAAALPLAAIGWIMSASGIGALLKGMAVGMVAVAGLLTRVAAGIATGLVGGFTAAVAQVGLLRAILGSLKSMAVVYVTFKAAGWVYDNWDRLRAWSQDGATFRLNFPEAPAWLKWIMDKVDAGNQSIDDAARTNRNNAAGRVDNTFAGEVMKWGDYFAGIGKQIADAVKSALSGPGARIEGLSAGAQNMIDNNAIPGVSVTTRIEPIQIQQGQLNIQYNGPIQGPASVPIKGSAPRGTSTVEGGAAAPAQ